MVFLLFIGLLFVDAHPSEQQNGIQITFYSKELKWN